MTVLARSALARLALASALASACHEPELPPRPEAGPAPAAQLEIGPELIRSGRVTTGTIELRSPEDELRATGYVVPDLAAAADVGALVLARVRDVKVREGDRVAKGELLAELDAPDAARVAAELGRAAAERIRAERALEREQRLIASQATTRGELEQAQANVAASAAEERAARLLLESFGAAGARVSVRAPIAGLVSQVGIELGSRVEAGDRLFRIVDPARFVVRAEVLERDAHRVAPGASGLMRFPDGRECKVRVAASGAEVEPKRHTVAVRLTPEACELGIAGQVLDVRIATSGTVASKLRAVPRDAVVELDGAPVVFVAGSKPGSFRVVPVLVERLTETTAFLEQGPPPGTRVAVKGTILLKGEWMKASLE